MAAIGCLHPASVSQEGSGSCQMHDGGAKKRASTKRSSKGRTTKKQTKRRGHKRSTHKKPTRGFKKGTKSRTRSGRLNFITHKGDKVYNADGHYQKSKHKPYSTYRRHRR